MAGGNHVKFRRRRELRVFGFAILSRAPYTLLDKRALEFSVYNFASLPVKITQSSKRR